MIFDSIFTWFWNHAFNERKFGYPDMRIKLLRISRTTTSINMSITYNFLLVDQLFSNFRKDTRLLLILFLFSCTERYSSLFRVRDNEIFPIFGPWTRFYTEMSVYVLGSEHCTPDGRFVSKRYIQRNYWSWKNFQFPVISLSVHYFSPTPRYLVTDLHNLLSSFLCVINGFLTKISN